MASRQPQSQHDSKMPQSAQRLLKSSHTGTTLRLGSLSYIAPWLFTKDTIKSSSTSTYCLRIPQTNCFWCQQEGFKLSRIKQIRTNSANASLGGNATVDPLGKCGWEKQQGWRTPASKTSVLSLTEQEQGLLVHPDSCRISDSETKASPLSSNSFTMSFIMSW